MFIDKLYTPLAIFNVLYVDYKLNKVTYRRFEDFLNAPEDRNLESGMTIKSIRGSIDVENLSFSYGQIEVFKNISLHIKEGTSVAFVGSSGGGKSTIIKLLLGLLKKREGLIRLDGIDMDQIKLNSFYDHISYISQEAPIFDTTIKGNLILDQTITDEAIYDILDIVGLKEKVLTLPEQLNTMVGEKGLKLSGGEKQRLAFARIIAQQRNMILLDEPMSALDNISEKKIMERFLQLYKGKTILIVAHRLNSIKNVDKIFVVKHGQIVADGNFEHLIVNCEYFKQLWIKKAH